MSKEIIPPYLKRRILRAIESAYRKGLKDGHSVNPP